MRRLLANRIAVKYLVISVVVLGGMALLNQLDVFDGVSGAVMRLMDRLASYGKVGMFILALLSNMTLVIIVPYNLPMFTLVIYADTLWEVAAIGAATGLGGGIGETASYAVAHSLASHIDHLSESALFRWMKRSIERRPRLIPLFVWLASATPIPDMTIIVPLSLIRYPWTKMIIPMITGKIVQNVVVALIFRSAADAAADLLSSNINFDLTAIFVALFILLIAYQIESARASQKRGEPPPSGQANGEVGRASAAD
ncbi:MAG: hypothetical protein IT325_05620 [Anaerolineae bacterium]|nr:hypothetical protein [Anaerolineae bacterium]